MLAIEAALLAASAAAAVELGQPIPNCPAVLADRTTPLDFSLHRGRVILVDFWAAWCAPCRQALPFLDALRRRYQDLGLEVIAINVDEDPGEALDFLARHPVAYAQSFDPQGACPRAFDLKVMPSSFLVDREGHLRAIHTGFRDRDAAAIVREVEDLIAR